MDHEQLARLCHALGDPTRAHIIQLLLGCCCPVGVGERGEVVRLEHLTAGNVCCHLTGDEKISTRISFHLKTLSDARLITMEKRGRYKLCSVDRHTLATLANFFNQSTQCGPCGQENTNDMNQKNREVGQDVRELVRKRYGEAAIALLNAQPSTCCGQSEADSNGGCCSTQQDPITSNLYTQLQADEIPEAALLASLGCGNPTALAQLVEGETVLDLGSGGGIDVLLSARRVGPTGFAYGLDMTDEMLELAERNRAEAGAENVKFLKGHIEQLPLPSDSVDVIISNCVINLSADKDQVLKEAFRVLKPGGRFAVSDVVLDGELPDAVRSDMEMYVGCVSGALERNEYVEKLAAQGFQHISIEPTRHYNFSALEGAWAPQGVAAMTEPEKLALDGKIMGAFIRAVKPA